MIDLHDPIQRGRVDKAIKTSKDSFYTFRRSRKEFIRDYVGSWYSFNGARNRTLVNLVNETARVFVQSLAANNPQVMVSCPDPKNWPFARRFEAALNQFIEDRDLDRVFRLIVLDAFFCIGCGLVCMGDTDTEFHGLLESEEDVWIDPGLPSLLRVSNDNLILDMSAKELTKMRFCGHEYRADFEKVKNEPAYDKAVRKKVTPTSKNTADNAEFAQDIATGGAVDDDELKPMLWLRDLWIPENNSVVTMVCDTDLPPLIERDWEGSKTGPYKFLALGIVPDNPVPCAPVVNLKGLHDLQNRLFRKMEKQSDDQKTLNIYAPGDEEQALTYQKAKNGAWIKARNPQGINQVKIGGVDSGNQAFSIVVDQNYNRFAGNIKGQTGLTQQAGTAKQEEILQSNIGEMKAGAQLEVVKFASECCYDLGFLMWNDDHLEVKASRLVRGVNERVEANWSPGNRKGEFEDYRFNVQVDSMMHKTPEQKLQELFAVLDKLAPMWPMFQQGGGNLDAQELLNQIADLLHRPEFLRLITFAAPAQQLGGDENSIRQSPVTSRETVRRNVPTGGTDASRASIMQQILAGSNVNQDQAASMTQ